MLPPFQTLLDLHASTVFRLLRARLPRDEVEDCFQETFMAALRAYPDLRDGSNLRAWLLRIAERKAIDAHRRRGRRAEAGSEPPDLPAPPPDEVDPELWAAVSALPLRQRTAVLHRYVDDLTYADIAAATGTTEQAARRAAHEGIKKLRRGWTP